MFCGAPDRRLGGRRKRRFRSFITAAGIDPSATLVAVSRRRRANCETEARCTTQSSEEDTGVASPRRGVRAIAVLVALIAISGVVTGTEQSQARTIATPNSAAAGKSRTLGETPDQTDIRIVAGAEYLSGES